ncbi:MAG TPA: acetate/propionate family kinase [Jatrophihabitans sp.]
MLVVNAGSSSLKLRLLGEDDAVLESADVAADSHGFDAAVVATEIGTWPKPDVVGHRVVHGGTVFSSAVRLDDGVERRLRELTDLAPLHQPKSLAGIDALRQVLPDVAAVACFDTAFHRTIPEAAATYPVPAEWRRRYAVRRYGFHGLSHAYVSGRAAAMLGDAAPDGQPRRVVTCHLGAGASLCAVLDGRSVDTTMGFTPLEGLMMATRSGSVDPGLVLWLEEHEGITPHEVAEALENRSGLFALAGTADMREVERRAASGDPDPDPDAVLALEVYLHRLVAGVAAMAAALQGLDALVFTGGVGENSAWVRSAAAQRLAWLGVAVDETANASPVLDAEISGQSADVRTLVVAAREDLQIATEVRTLLAAG